MPRPRIGLTCNWTPPAHRSEYSGRALQYVEQSMIDAVVAAGGIPVFLPLLESLPAEEQLSLVDGLLLTGGADVDATTAGRADSTWPGQPERDAWELGLLATARSQAMPVLGVCRGHQLLNCAFGGTLVDDLTTRFGADAPHRNTDGDTAKPWRHGLRIREESWLADLFDTHEVEVNSAHHQAIERLGDGLSADAWSTDGLIEAISVATDAWTRAVQWHPEWDAGQPHRRLFEQFVAACRARGDHR